MATARDQAVSDFRKKLILERSLLPKIRTINGKIVRQFTKELAKSGNVINSAEFDAELNLALMDHYRKVGAEFDDQILLPKDVAKTEEEADAISDALLLYYLTRAADQTTIINTTTQGQMGDSVRIGNEEAARMAAEGQPISAIEAAVISGAVLSRKLRARSVTISETETQAVAETAKATNASILLFQQPDTIAITPRAIEATKEWVTFGDERVRSAHLAADSIEVNVTEPFTVGGELLMRPGDTSMGASAGNIINCRCSAVYSQEQITAIRRAA